MTKAQLTVATLGMVSSGILGAMLGAGIVQHRPAATFDYESCTVIAAKGDLSTAPETPDWVSMETTPGGNWCIRTRR